MTPFNLYSQETQLLHGGQKPDPETGARAVPIHQTTSYVFDDTEHAHNLFGLTEEGNIYSRMMNPTVDAFEQRMALLEDGSAAVAVASGMAAITLSILNLASSGDEIIADSSLYGGTHNLFANTLPRYGIHVTFVDGTDPAAFEKAITANTKAFFGEIITNPGLNILDVETIAAIAHRNGIPLIIDNTFATPYGTRPISWGADVVVHSATKWIGGHGTAIAGVVIDGGRFQWDNGNFPEFTEPDDSYNGLRYADLSPAAFAMKLRVQLLRDIGACLSPQNAFLLLQGLETLHLRVERHNANAAVVADFLNSHPAVEWVNYPGHPGHPSHQLANKYLDSGYGSIITFGVEGGRKVGQELIDNVTLWSHVANVGDAKSLIIHPASTTHQQLSTDELTQSGVTEELVRLSVGLEATQDILADLDQAIAKASGRPAAIQPTEDDAIRWLLHSPFDRTNGTVRPKTIAVFGLNSGDDRFAEDVSQLKQSGFQIVPIGTEDSGTSESLDASPYQVDAILTNQHTLPPEITEQAIEQKTAILWTEQPAAHYDQSLERARTSGLTVISGRRAYEEAYRLRHHNPAEEMVHT
ncbi:hypothetical protein GCM10028778_23740 [Barrientosiimonas marina]|uniref:PLP-dependent transferase n=1 Tax=Lentibacillus kimchii TaxID=1542911 RepID=A0ABW2V0U7_9BACI